MYAMSYGQVTSNTSSIVISGRVNKKVHAMPNMQESDSDFPAVGQQAGVLCSTYTRVPEYLTF